jgi:hypothetical protein
MCCNFGHVYNGGTIAYGNVSLLGYPMAILSGRFQSEFMNGEERLQARHILNPKLCRLAVDIMTESSLATWYFSGVFCCKKAIPEPCEWNPCIPMQQVEHVQQWL